MAKFVQYGAGNIGRGFIGQLFSQAGYEVVFIDINQAVVEKLNKDRCYPVKIVSEESTHEIIVSNVRAVNGLDSSAVSSEIATADIMATSVGVNVLPRIIDNLISGFRIRWTSNADADTSPRPLDILLCENLHNASAHMRKMFLAELNIDESDIFNSTIGLVEASIGRMVPVMTPQMQEGNILRVAVEEYSELPVDKDAFKGKIPDIKNILPASPFAYYVDRKLYIHNMGHAIAAYTGSLKGYKFIWESMVDTDIRKICTKAMKESAMALSNEYNIPLEQIEAHAEDLVKRFGNKLLGDTVERVGRDSLRKLSPEDRLVGAANLCVRNKVYPENICKGIAAALLFNNNNNNNSDDAGTSSVQEMIKNSGYEAVLTNICKLEAGSKLFREILQQLDDKKFF